MRRRAAKARLEREEARQRRWRALATPTAKPSTTAAANCEQLVIAEYADGWRHCCQWAVGSAPPTAAQVRGASPYWFNVRSGESRWTPPPSLSRLQKTRPRLRSAAVQQSPMLTSSPGLRPGSARPGSAQTAVSGARKPARMLGRPRSSNASATRIYNKQPLVRRRSSVRPQSARGMLQSGGGRADGHARLPVPQPPRTRPASAAVAQRSRGRGLGEERSQGAKDAEGSADDAVAYMQQWQHQKYVSGPRRADGL